LATEFPDGTSLVLDEEYNFMGIPNETNLPKEEVEAIEIPSIFKDNDSVSIFRSKHSTVRPNKPQTNSDNE
jgi:hypothetical protein